MIRSFGSIINGNGVSLNRLISGRIEDKRSAGQNGSEVLPTPLEPNEHSKAQHLLNVLIHPIGSCDENIVSVHNIGWNYLTIYPANDDSLQEAEPEQTHSRGPVIVEELEHIHSSLRTAANQPS